MLIIAPLHVLLPIELLPFLAQVDILDLDGVEGALLKPRDQHIPGDDSAELCCLVVVAAGVRLLQGQVLANKVGTVVQLWQLHNK